MRKMIAATIAFVACALVVGASSAGSLPALTSPPTDFTCSFAMISIPNDAITCTWTASAGANKYSVDVIANYDLGNALGSMSADFDFGTTAITITIPLSAFPTDINLDTVPDTLVSVVLRVKGLVPPGKNVNNQNNTFSPTLTCTIGGSCA
jgi:hypothetical protein